MVDHDNLDAVLAACPSCDGLGLQMDTCGHSDVADHAQCSHCESGSAPSLCHYCDATGMVCAQVVISVINVDLATVASTQVVAGAHRPRRLLDGTWGIDCRAIAAELAGQVSAFGLGGGEEIIALPEEYHPDLPVGDRYELESTAIARAAQRSRWRVRQAAPMSASLSSSDLAAQQACDCRLQPAAVEADSCVRCRRTEVDTGVAPPITIPHRSATSPTNEPRPWTLDHLTQVGFGLGLRLDITCRMSTVDGDDKPIWAMTWSATDQTASPPPDGVTDFDQAVRLAAAQLGDAPNSMFSRSELIPVPRQAMPPVVGVRRAETILMTLARQGACDAVLCRIASGECSISRCTGRYVELISRGADLESAATGIGL